MAPIRGHFLLSQPFRLVVPVVMVTPDHEAVSIMVVPAAMPSSIMAVKLGTRPAVTIVVVPVRADAETKTLGTRDCRRCNCDGR